MRTCLLVVVALVGGCKSKDSGASKPVTCDVAAQMVTRRLGEFADKANVTGEKRAALDKAMTSAITARCTADAWDEATLGCLGAVGRIPKGDIDASTYNKGVDVCTKAIGSEKHAKLDKDVQATIGSVMRPAEAKADAPTADAPKPAVAKVEPPKTVEGRAFLLGHDLGYATFMRVRGADVTSRFSAAAQSAKEFAFELPVLPAPAKDKVEGSSAALEYALNTSGEPLAKAIEAKSGKRASMLFDIALKSEVLRLLYIGEKDDLTGRIADTIEQGSKLAKLPAELAKPLTEKIRNGAPADDVETAIDAWTTAALARIETAEEVAETRPAKAKTKRPAKPSAKPTTDEGI